MTERKSHDWEMIERGYRAGQLTVVEIGRQHGLSHTAINKRAKRDGWTRNLADKVRKGVSARLVSAETSPETERAAIEPAVARGVQVVREHQASIGRGQRLVGTLFDELEKATVQRVDFEAAIEEETRADKTGERRSRMLRAIALPSRAAVLGSLSSALRTLVGLERQAFNLDEAGGKDAAPTQHYDLSVLSLEELSEFRRLVEKTTGAGRGEGGEASPDGA
jgi:hypothetical protein